MRRGTRAAVVVFATVALAAAVVASAGGAANSKVSVSIGFNPGASEPFFKGRVKSGRQSCASNRLVRVYRQQNKRRLIFGSDRSDSSGFWRVRINSQMKTAGYIAVAKAKTGCLKGFSKSIAVGQDGPGGAG